MATQPPQLPSTVYATFSGAVDQAATQRIATGFSVASQGKVVRFHLLFQSAGGTVGDGIYLYNLFKALPFELVIYNGGHVASIAVIAFLGAKTRNVSAHGAFMLHRTQNMTTPLTASKLKGITETLSVDDRRTEDILRKHIELPEELWKKLDREDVYFNAEDAIKCRIADKIAEFAPPLGTTLYAL